MHRVRILLMAALLASTGWCLAGTTEPASAAEAVGGKVELDVRAGRFSSEDVKAAPSQTYALVMGSLHLHEKWAPLQSVCAIGRNDAERACVTVWLRDRESRRLAVRISLRSKGAEEQFQTGVDGNFFTGKEIRVKATIRPGDVAFKINGMAVMSRPISFQTEKIQLGCSSAECSFIRRR
jgi:hypothetical protein